MKEMVNPLPCYSCTMMTFGSLFGLGSLPLVASVNAKQLLFLFFFSFSLFFDKSLIHHPHLNGKTLSVKVSLQHFNKPLVLLQLSTKKFFYEM